MRRRIYLFGFGVILGAAIAFLPGCNTLTGIARDVEAASRGIAEALAREPDPRY